MNCSLYRMYNFIEAIFTEHRILNNIVNVKVFVCPLTSIGRNKTM